MPFEFHDGERRIQSRLGVADQAARVQRSIHDRLPPVAAQFLELQPFVILGGASGDHVWASLLRASPGFATAPDPRIVRVRGMLPPEDPLFECLVAGGDLGMLWIDLLHRQRMRVNGRARAASNGFEVEVVEAYSNCPQYITPRAMPGAGAPDVGATECKMHVTTSLVRRQRDWIRNADTFFIASRHPDVGADVSHRGGPPGFVGIDDEGRLAWPDYPGNTMFNTLGNLVVDPRAGLLFVDFETSRTLQVAGRTVIEWGDGANAERRVRFHTLKVIDSRRTER